MRDLDALQNNRRNTHAAFANEGAQFFRVFRVFRGNFSSMKSAYELAMERLAKSEPAEVPLSAVKKTRLAEIDRLYKGKIAEREIFLKQQLDTALSDQKFDEADKIRKQISSEKARLEEERDEDKERVRREK
jgi:cysteinyl-tRNA synthetase